MAKHISLNEPAPGFELVDFNGRKVSLSTYRGHQNVVLVFNRGFM